MRRITTLVGSSLALMMLILFVHSSARSVSAEDNLLRNPSFEGNYSAWQIQYGTAQMAADWTPWWIEDENHDPVWAQPEYKPAEKQFFSNRVLDGERAQQWFTFYKSHYGGLYQQISGVTPGNTYRFSVYAQAWSSAESTIESVTPGDPRFEIGISPTGDAQPGFIGGPPINVEWSGLAPMSGIIDQWQLMTIDVVAQSSTITVYMKANPQWALKHNDIYVDAASLVDMGRLGGGNTGGGNTGGGSGDCQIPASGPWPPCATSGGYQGNPDCEIPPTGPWPPCATGGGSAGGNTGGGTADGGTTGGNTGDCEIPASGPWPPCATSGGNADPNCVIPRNGPWPPCATGGGTNTGGGGSADSGNGGGTTTPPPPTGGSAGFKLGGQTHTLANPDTMLDVGMDWVKFQHKWSKGDSGDAVRGRIEDAHNRGFKVLLSIPGSDHNNIDYDAYVEFLGQVAALGPDAIEVWNEMNIDREWPADSIDGANYVNRMLKPAYQKIKAVNSSVMVISGAPAPTGFFGGGCGASGCDDKPYIEAMASAGAANYMDCVGVHYNEGILSPNQRSGDPRGNSGHYTRYFWSMVDTYYNAFGGSRKLCFTELGYLSGEDYGGLPGGFSWARDTTLEQHGQWLGEATSLSRSSAKIDMLIIFNVDFDLFEPNGDPQAGFAMIRRNGSCPSCSHIKAAMGR